MDTQKYFKDYYNNNKDKYRSYYLKYKNSHLTECDICNKSYLNIHRHMESIKHTKNNNSNNIIDE